MKTKGGRYSDGTSSYQRVSNLLKNIETDTYNLELWKQRQVAIGMSQRPDLVLGVAAAAQFDPATGKLTKDAKDAINDLCKQAMNEAKSRAGQNRGNAVHTATERLDLGESVEQIALPYPFNADLAAYETLKRVMGLSFRPEHIERTVVIDAVQAAGTFDRLGTSIWLEQQGILAPDELIVIDVKTEDDPLLNMIHICPQLACYANADRMFIPAPTAEDVFAGTYEPMPEVSRIVGLVIHVRNGRAIPYLVNLTDGWRAARRAAEQRDDLKQSKLAVSEEGAWAVALPNLPLPAAADLVATAHERGPMGFSAPPGTPAGGAPAEHAVGDQVTVAGVTFTKHGEQGDPLGELRGQLIEAIWQTTDLGGLAALYEQATTMGVHWNGAVQMAGTGRQRVIECVQRAMHDPATTSKCACGWERGMAA